MTAVEPRPTPSVPLALSPLRRTVPIVATIHYADVLPLVFDACPSFKERYPEYPPEWTDEERGLFLYLALADFARHLVAIMESGGTDSLPPVFALVERLHTEGEHSVREAATVGLLEYLQNDNFHTVTTPQDFRPFLGPESLRSWKALSEFWDGGEPIPDDDPTA